jgi:hypothetical protein
VPVTSKTKLPFETAVTKFYSTNKIGLCDATCLTFQKIAIPITTCFAFFPQGVSLGGFFFRLTICCEIRPKKDRQKNWTKSQKTFAFSIFKLKTKNTQLQATMADTPVQPEAYVGYYDRYLLQPFILVASLQFKSQIF